MTLGRDIDELIEEEKQAVKEGWAIVGETRTNIKICYNCVHYNRRHKLCNTGRRKMQRAWKPTGAFIPNPMSQYCGKWVQTKYKCKGV